METTSVKVLEKYNEAFRDLLNAKNRSSDDKVQTLLQLSTPEDWGFICTAMDIIGDTCLAIKDFLQFGLSGPTKHYSMGEKYLRLYGILNAAFLQQEAIFNLHRIVALPDHEQVRNKIESLKVRDARQKLGSHSNGYENPQTGKLESFIPVRMDLSDFSCGSLSNRTDSYESFELKKCLDEQLHLIIDLFDQIYEKAINTHYELPGEERDSFLENLSDLRLIRDGGTITILPDGTKFRMAAPIFVASDMSEADDE